MTLILVTQFNSFYQTALVGSAIVLSIVGVLIGLLPDRAVWYCYVGGWGYRFVGHSRQQQYCAY